MAGTWRRCGGSVPGHPPDLLTGHLKNECPGALRPHLWGAAQTLVLLQNSPENFEVQSG